MANTLNLAKGAVEPQHSGVVGGNTFKPSKGAVEGVAGSVADFVPYKTIAIRGIGQSNMAGPGTNTDKVSFTPSDGLYLESSPTEAKWLTSDWGHGDGASQNSPLFWFIEEIKRLTGRFVTATLTATAGIPVTPGAGEAANYWAPTHPDADEGQESLMETYADNFAYFKRLNDNTREINVIENIALVFESESDIFLLSQSDPGISAGRFRFHLDRWLNAMRVQGVTTFAIIKPGRRGATEGAADSFASFVSTIRGVYDDVIAANDDCFDVFPNLVEDPDPWVIDNLRVYDGSGAWVSGQANEAGGVHYTQEQYKAIGVTAARNLYEQYLMANTVKRSKGAVEPPDTGASGNRFNAWKGAVEPVASTVTSLLISAITKSVTRNITRNVTEQF